MREPNRFTFFPIVHRNSAISKISNRSYSIDASKKKKKKKNRKTLKPMIQINSLFTVSDIIRGRKVHESLSRFRIKSCSRIAAALWTE